MKVVLAGAFGNLGAEILKVLCADGHQVVAADLKERPIEGTEGKYTFQSIDATDPKTLKGLCDGADVAITTMGLTTAQRSLRHMISIITATAIFFQRLKRPASRNSITFPSFPAKNQERKRFLYCMQSICLSRIFRRAAFRT